MYTDKKQFTYTISYTQDIISHKYNDVKHDKVGFWNFSWHSLWILLHFFLVNKFMQGLISENWKKNGSYNFAIIGSIYWSGAIVLWNQLQFLIFSLIQSSNVFRFSYSPYSALKINFNTDTRITSNNTFRSHYYGIPISF